MTRHLPLLIALIALAGCESASAQGTSTHAGTYAGTQTGRIAYAPAASGSLFLDGLAAPAACWSVNERLLTTYTGSLGRIVRASDSTESDVGYGGDNLVNQSTITSFCSGTTCTWKTVYDQCGSARDVTQATASKQPRAYASGAIDKSGANVVALHDGTDDDLSAASSLGITGSSATTFFALYKLTASSFSYGIFDVGVDGHDLSWVATASTSVKVWVDGDAGERAFTTSSQSTYHYDLTTTNGNTNTATWRKDGADLSVASTVARASSITSGNPAAWIGSYRGNAGFAAMAWSTFVAWGSVISGGDTSTLETRAEARRTL